MVREDRAQNLLALRQKQRCRRALRKGRDCFVGRGEDRESAAGLQRVGEACGLDRGEQRLELRRHGGVDDATGTTVGLARVVTDRATFAWPCDVCIEEPWRGQEVSRRMLEALERHPDLQPRRRWCLATRDAHCLSTKFGDRPVPSDRWMEKPCPKEWWQRGA
jgi:hypothetical protein